jgi:amino acid permease
MRLVDNWRKVLAKAWSVKFNIAAALLSAAELVVQFWQPASIRPGVFAGIAFLVSLGAFMARIVAQKELTNDGK